MEKRQLSDFEKEMTAKGVQLGSRADKFEPWYNAAGDCIEFQTRQVAIIGQRIDEYLTIFRSAIDNEPIGFQLKDIKALIYKFGLMGIACNAEIDEKNTLVSVTELLLRAYETAPGTPFRRTGYTTAFKSSPTPKDEVPIPVSV